MSEAIGVTVTSVTDLSFVKVHSTKAGFNAVPEYEQVSETELPVTVVPLNCTAHGWGTPVEALNSILDKRSQTIKIDIPRFERRSPDKWISDRNT